MKKNKVFWLFAVCLLMITTGIVTKTFQNDTFFTIPTGNYILENGVNDVEPFTWHENLKFTKLRWAFDITVAKIYQIAGFSGLYVFTIIIAFLIAFTIFTTLSKNVGIIVCDASCLEIDSNILNNRCMNNDFKLIIKGNILKVRKWIENNKVRYIECENLEKDIYNLYNSKEATVLVIKGGK